MVFPHYPVSSAGIAVAAYRFRFVFPAALMQPCAGMGYELRVFAHQHRQLTPQALDDGFRLGSGPYFPIPFLLRCALGNAARV